MIALGCIGLFYGVVGYPSIDYQNLVFGTLIFLFGVFTAFYIAGRKVDVYTDRIVSITRFTTKTEMIDDMTGTAMAQDFFCIHLEPKGSLKIPWYLKNSLKLKKTIDAIIKDREELMAQSD